MQPVQIIIWVVLIAAVLYFLIAPKLKKKKFEGQDMTITENWYEESLKKYGDDATKKAYFFNFDKNYTTQGHVMVDQNKNPVYEAKVLFGDPVKGYDTDLINHVIDYKHHHRIGAPVSTGVESDGAGITTTSHFKFDGQNIWRYLESLGYTYKFTHSGLSYTIPVFKNNEQVGTIYSSNNGKNYFGHEAPFEAKAGGAGICIVECADKDLDALFLLAMAFARTELSVENLK